MKRTLGGDRLGSGKKMKVEMRNYERSTHDLSYLWRSTMSAGTLVPFMSQVALPGDTFDIDLDCDIKTHPTVGPLFGSFKVQLDVFQCPIRLYNGQLHNNKLGIGLKMSSVKFPIIKITPFLFQNNGINGNGDYDNQQVNPSCLLAYLGIRGIGQRNETPVDKSRSFNAIPLLAYYDIYKNYFSNKQEEIGYIVHTPPEGSGTNTIDTIQAITNGNTYNIPTFAGTPVPFNNTTQIIVNYALSAPTYSMIQIYFNGNIIPLTSIATLISDDTTTQSIWAFNQIIYGNGNVTEYSFTIMPNQTILLQQFNLSSIDDIRENILTNTTSASPVNVSTLSPISYVLATNAFDQSIRHPQEGLAIKTYQSDLLNNWLDTEFIDGTGGINDITSISTVGDKFTVDSLNLAKKVYDMLNRIAVSGGTYDDWVESVYTEETFNRAETPIYEGGLIKELIFQEVVSNSQAAAGDSGGTQPLGTLAGKGAMAKKHKGGKIIIKVKEPSYIIGIVSLTPRIDYSQGNNWDINLQTMDDLHKPALDQIGFQELITEQMAWWDTTQNSSGVWVQKSAGKQPAWLNYMTNVNKTYGNFAIKTNEMFMTLNRQYQLNTSTKSIQDLTTYIDPVKYNQIFAQTSLDAQNFWTQIAVNITARRKMSAKIMPNL